MANAKLDQNSNPSLIAVSNADSSTPVRIEADPTTKRLLVNATVSGAGSGGTSATDGDAFTANDSAGTPVMGVFDDASPSTLTENDLGIIRATENRALHVNLRDASGAEVSVGGGTQYTEDAAAAANPVGTALMMVRDDALSGQTTTDGDNVAARGTDKGELYVKHADSIAVTQSGTWDEVGINDSGNSITVDNGGTFATQVTGDALTALQLIDDAVFVDDADWTDNTSKHINIGGVYQSSPHTVTDGDVSPALMDVNGRLIVAATDNGGTLSIDDGGGVITVDGTVAVTNAGLTELAAAINASSQMDVNIAASGATVPVSNAGLTSLNGAIAGTEVQVDIVAALPAGTNAIGKLAANSGVDIGDVDVTSLPALVAGTAYIGKTLPPDRDVTLHTNYAKKYYTNAGAVTDGIIWSPAAGTRWHVVSMFINTSATATITLEDDLAAGDSAVMKMELAANSGTIINFGEHYPLASGEDAADLLVTTSAGNIYITCTGYEI